MTERYELSRRKVLAGLGTIGLAGTGAGFGTTAYFNDTESFKDNTLTAGSLDLKVDWEEHYSFQDGEADAGLDSGISRTEPTEDAEAYVGLPDPEDPVVWVHEDDLSQYMDNTAIESFPDPNGDGVQEMRLESEGELNFEYAPCRDGADVDTQLDPIEGLRTTNGDTYNERADDPVQPLINLEDVKPGDFGELTLSFHLCDNAGYVWLQAGNVTESENGLTEPETDVDDTAEMAELAENIQTVWWYDTNGNNVVDSSIGAIDVMVAVDTSGSLSGSEVSDLEDAANGLASDLETSADARVGGLSFGGGSIEDFTALADGPVTFSGLTANGDTPMPAALDIAAAELDANGRTGAETFIVLFTDGGPNYENRTYEAGGYSAGSGYTGANPNSTVDQSEMDETAAVAGAIRDNHNILTVGIDADKDPTGREGEPGVALLSTYLRDEISGDPADYFSADDSEMVSDLQNAILEAVAMPEEVFRRGTLGDDLDALSSGNGIPLDADPETDFDELSGPGDSENRECFQPGVNHYVGFGWWLPSDVGNEVQSDSVSFDLGFYTEQCRHNDGSGLSTT
ncbi:SipW-dependent-type signal peptide-containing protein [Halorhabdus rudnickae]|uniref:SipW-dependent-type signal peptide-containing protein n=1 Tax=Halorhabdus rudnickae TaxID=1775544 RepID=UPI00108369F5|nr:vWA domain-containing protein [Halorhabdus rudnickae]